jgi:nitrite reductase/ring-hydroxylating ferredoxin subunit
LGFLKQIFGICETTPPADPGCWQFADGTVELDLSRTPELAAAGAAVRLEGKSLPERLLLVHGEDGSFYAYVNRCTHGGRRIDPSTGHRQIRCCSVSKSIFDYAGQPVSGAAEKPLTTLPVTRVDNLLLIGTAAAEAGEGRT